MCERASFFFFFFFCSAMRLVERERRTKGDVIPRVFTAVDTIEEDYASHFVNLM